ncbi:MAG TPA: V4R domain-containing protein [Gemmatimonadales bacterium]|nr:V4R domain-containing protein [Gemmatimonadales bacterium]
MSIARPPRDAVTIGRGALPQLRQSLLRDAADHAVGILQEAGFAAGEGIYQAFCGWVAAETGVPEPQNLDAARLSTILSSFFESTGWGSLTVGPLGAAALAMDSADWVEAEPGSAETPMCFFTSGMLADFLGRLSGEPVAVLEVECRSKDDARCRFLSASPDTLNAVYDHVSQGRPYTDAFGA